MFHQGNGFHHPHAALPAQGKLATVGMDPILLARASAREYPVPLSFLSAQSLIQVQDMESIVQVHRRKMQRRQANRKSAQLSRARKKAHLEELKEENSRLQKLVNILDSLPEFVFTFNAKGAITYLPERLSTMIKSAADDPDEDIVHVNQVLTVESAQTLFESVNELIGPHANDQSVTFVKEVFYQDATGFPVAGYMRCSRVTRSVIPLQEDEGESDSESGTSQSQSKLKKRRPDSELERHAELLLRRNSGESSESSSKSDEPDEFVCVIRPASASSPHGLNNLHLLSAASMVAHDSHQRSGSDKEDKRRGSGSPSDGSHSSLVPRSSVSTHTTQQTKNSTSSETGSEDNPSSDEPSA